MFFSSKVHPDTVVVISGCDSGFGRMLAVQLHARGYNVFAGCLTDTGLSDLSKEVGVSKYFTALKLDVTSAASVREFAAAVSAAVPRVHALVNNAGVFCAGYVDWLPMEDLRNTMEVNFFGVVEMTKAFLPMIMEKHTATGRRGRVINVSSAAGLVAGPGWSAYCASKFALEGWSDSLRREVGCFGIPVVLIEPSFLKTPLIDNPTRFNRKTWAAAPAETRARWGEAFAEEVSQRGHKATAEAEPAQLAVDALVKAVGARSPRLRYKPNFRSRTFYYYLSLLPAGLVDAMSNADNKTKALPTWVQAPARPSA